MTSSMPTFTFLQIYNGGYLSRHASLKCKEGLQESHEKRRTLTQLTPRSLKR